MLRRAAFVAGLVITTAIVSCTSGGSPAESADTTAATASQATGAAPQARSAADWPAYHRNRARSGYVAGLPVARQLSVVARLTLDGAVYASPIVAEGRTFVATENDTVYALDSHNRRLWRHHLARPSPQSQRPCGNIDPLGITGTPVYNYRGHGTLYVAAETGGSTLRHVLYALRPGTGTVRWKRSLDLPGVERAAMQQRGALTISAGRVWVPFGGLAGDCGNYKGRVIGYPLDGTGRAVSFTVPTAREAGIWTPPGPSVDSDGRLYVSVGNGASGPGDRYDHSDSVLKLDGHAKLIGSFSPRSWASDNASDLDLGSQGPALVGKWIFIAGKSGTAYVLRRSHLGGIGGQVSSSRLCTSFGGTAVVGNTVYVPCTDGVRAVRIDSTGHLHVRWHAASNITGSPVVGGGRVWSLDTGAGVLHALSGHRGRTVTHVAVGACNRFATPALSGRRVLIGTLSGLTVVRTS